MYKNYDYSNIEKSFHKEPSKAINPQVKGYNFPLIQIWNFEFLKNQLIKLYIYIYILSKMNFYYINT